MSAMILISPFLFVVIKSSTSPTVNPSVKSKAEHSSEFKKYPGQKIFSSILPMELFGEFQLKKRSQASQKMKPKTISISEEEKEEVVYQELQERLFKLLENQFDSLFYLHFIS